MITRLEIEGFKSFGSPAEAIELGPLNVAVGANASGKTNLLSALRFLQDAVLHDISHAVSEMGGRTEVKNKRLHQQDEPRPIRLHVKMKKDFAYAHPTDPPEVNSNLDDLEYEIEIDLEGDCPEIGYESLAARSIREGKVERFGFVRESGRVTVTDPLFSSNAEGVPSVIRVPERESTHLALMGVGVFSLPAVFLRDEIRSWSFHNIIPDVARQPYREEPWPSLGAAGERLASVLHKMSHEDRRAIANGLKGIVPGLDDVKITKLPIEDTLAFQIVEDGLRAEINPVSVSDGTVRLLSLLVLTTWNTRSSSLVAVEEPENGVHPHLAEYLVEIVKSASRQSQMILTTHEPTLLDHLEPDQVILCDKEDGFTKVRKASSVAEIEKFREHFSLGELWTQGVVGAIP